MRIDVSLCDKSPSATGATRPVADNDDDPFDPPPARAARPPLPPVETIAIADAVERMARAA
jgi:hypothetical protein